VARVIRSSEVIMVRRKLRDAQEARRCLREVAESGRSRAEWAQENGVDARSLNAWRLNLERRADARTAPRLVELVAAPGTRSSARYTVRVGELAVEVDDGFDDEVLRRLISVVASC
jgi:transposase-like protein